MRRIVIDSYPVSTPYTGLGEFCIQICKRLSKRAKELRQKYNIELYFMLPPQYTGCFGNEVKYICISASLRRYIPLYPFKADIFHIPYQCSKVKCMYFAKKQLLTIHDINFIYEKSGRGLKKSSQRLSRRIKHSDYLSYISKFAYEDTERYFNTNKPYKIIYNGVSDLSTTSDSSVLPSYLPDNFLFHISSLQPKKNIHLLVDMMKYLPEHNLVIVGSWNNSYANNLKQKIEKNNIKNIFMLPNVTEQEKAALFSACKAFLFPSLCEGFGLPPIEAMKLGKPVFLSTLTSLPEIGGKDAFYWNDLNPKSMANTLKEQLKVYNQTPEYADRLKQNAARFNWEKCVDEYIKYYLEILKE